jgi:hypothetical protein
MGHAAGQMTPGCRRDTVCSYLTVDVGIGLVHDDGVALKGCVCV